MKAAVLEERGTSGLRICDFDKPHPKSGEALIRIEAASLNRVDVYMRDNGAGITHSLPQILGVDAIGHIEAINGDSPLTVGQRVILYPYHFCGTCEHCLDGDQPLCTSAKIPGEHLHGTFAEYITLPIQSLLPLSEKVDAKEAACLGVAYLTAWRMVFGKAQAKAGKTCLIVGAGGGVACASVQLAKLAGCEVIATTSGEDKCDKIKLAGADHVIDYRSDDVVKTVMSLTKKRGVDFVIDNVGDATWSSSLKCLKRGGDIVTCGATTGAHPSADLQRLFIRQLSVHGSTMGNIKEFTRLVKTFENGHFKPIIDSVFELDGVCHAFERLEDPARFGKVVLQVS